MNQHETSPTVTILCPCRPSPPSHRHWPSSIPIDNHQQSRTITNPPYSSLFPVAHDESSLGITNHPYHHHLSLTITNPWSLLAIPNLHLHQPLIKHHWPLLTITHHLPSSIIKNHSPVVSGSEHPILRLEGKGVAEAPHQETWSICSSELQTFQHQLFLAFILDNHWLNHDESVQFGEDVEFDKALCVLPWKNPLCQGAGGTEGTEGAKGGQGANYWGAGHPQHNPSCVTRCQGSRVTLHCCKAKEKKLIAEAAPSPAHDLVLHQVVRTWKNLKRRRVWNNLSV